MGNIVKQCKMSNFKKKRVLYLCNCTRTHKSVQERIRAETWHFGPLMQLLKQQNKENRRNKNFRTRNDSLIKYVRDLLNNIFKDMALRKTELKKQTKIMKK